MKNNIKISMIAAADVALKYKAKNPKAIEEEVIKHIIKNFKTKKDVKVYSIAAASFALKYKEKNPKAREKEITQKVMNESDSIIKSVEEK